MFVWSEWQECFVFLYSRSIRIKFSMKNRGWKYSMDLGKTKVFREKPPIFYQWPTSSPMPFDRELNSESNTSDFRLNISRLANRGWKYSMDFGKTKVFREKPPIFYRWPTSSPMPFDRELNSESNTSDSRLNASRWANRGWKYSIGFGKPRYFERNPLFFTNDLLRVPCLSIEN